MFKEAEQTILGLFASFSPFRQILVTIYLRSIYLKPTPRVLPFLTYRFSTTFFNRRKKTTVSLRNWVENTMHAFGEDQLSARGR